MRGWFAFWGLVFMAVAWGWPGVFGLVDVRFAVGALAVGYLLGSTT